MASTSPHQEDGVDRHSVCVSMDAQGVPVPPVFISRQLDVGLQLHGVPWQAPGSHWPLSIVAAQIWKRYVVSGWRLSTSMHQGATSSGAEVLLGGKTPLGTE
ncbi:MAG: hypothetical protein KAJ19_08700, partial [Gammaproteobacteria bacterium]|nr:hypothetical protein [Gammaproteobacteria bacterium]